MKVLGIDTALRSTGIGVVDEQAGHLVAVDYGRIRNPQDWAHSQCLVAIHEGIGDVIAKTKPDCVALEGGFFSRNAKTAMILGQARGVAIAACALHGLSVYEYSPRRVKQAVVGSGSATKDQIGKMVASLLSLEKAPQHDAADALALAICHLHSKTTVQGLEPKGI
jgi:crossover junction endodeoxyribonuclease RuvC